MPPRLLAASLIALSTLLAAPALAQGFAGMASDAEGFAYPEPDPDFEFPVDHGPHPDFRIEWWYVTANLEGPEGRTFGAQWTLFRSALAPEDGTGWQTPQIWFAHAAVTTPERHFTAERIARGGIGQAGVALDPFEAWIDDWSMTSTATGEADALSAVDLSATGPRIAYDLSLTAEGPLVPQGADGYSVKSTEGQASYYYSQPFYRAEGTLALPEGEVAVTGRAWLDREWSSEPLSEAQEGWDWVALHLADGAKLMGYRMRESGGGAYVTGTWIAPDGSARPLAPGTLEMRPLAAATVAGHEVPVRWQVALPARDLEITLAAVNAEAWMDTNVAYWEGPITVSGTHDGVGYLEMTGYD